VVINLAHHRPGHRRRADRRRRRRPCFFINAASFLAVIGALAIMRPPSFGAASLSRARARQVRAGLRYA
jgi:hypothetical protein